MNIPPAVLELRAALGDKVVELPEAFAGRQHLDAGPTPCAEPIALIRPTTVEQVSKEAREATQMVYAITGELGGSVSAEHGIGVERVGVLGRSRTAAEIGTMRLIKNALDPKGILNPGKVLRQDIQQYQD